MSERRYRENEVREIFGLATRGSAEPRSVTKAEGLTLSELQGIGREVGLDPAAVARAAAAFDARALKSRRRKSLGMPVEVGRVVPLPRPPTDSEWEQLVTELRSTFRARGTVRSEGSIREWSNGNLHACIEPTEGGYRLRLGTLKGDASGVNALGVTGVAAGVITSVALVVAGALPDTVFVPAVFFWGGISAFVFNLVRLPRWVRQRDQQMEHIAARVTAIVATKPSEVREP